jgi:Tfp pilus assembly protein PilO
MIVPLTNRFQKYWVQLQISIWRQGWVVLLLILLLACVLCLKFVFNPQLNAQLVADKNSLKIEQNKHQKLIITLPTALTRIDPELTSELNNLKKLNERVYAQKDVGNLLQLIAQIAKSKNVSLVQSEIQTIKEGHGGLQQLQVTLPVRTGYIEMRQFIKAVLRQMNGVSVDQVNIKRDNVSQDQFEASIKLSLWIDVNKQTSRAASQP